MYLLFDIGGTKMRFAVSPDLRHISQAIIVPTPQTVDEMIAILRQELHKLTGNQPIKAAAGGIAVILDKDNARIVNAMNMKGWIHEPIKQKLEELLRVPIFLTNDAAIVGLGEALSGPGLGHDIVAYITIGTGVGGARIVKGKIDPTAHGFEPGHQIISVGEQPDGTPVFGYLEDFISGTALKKAYGKPASEITDKQVWDDVAFFLAIGLNNVIVHWSPDVIVLGGSVAQQIDVDKVREYLKKNMRIFPELPLIIKAKLDDVGGLYGALEFLKQKTVI